MESLAEVEKQFEDIQDNKPSTDAGSLPERIR